MTTQDKFSHSRLTMRENEYKIILDIIKLFF